jgi:hypothetical protein
MPDEASVPVFPVKPVLEVPSVADRLIFVIAPPRSGSTLLMRMLNATSSIWSRAEPHLLTPLAHLGFYENVDKAPFDHLQSQQATREFVSDLPGQEADYVDAIRAYADVLYGRMMANAPAGERYFLEKTPAYGLLPQFMARLYPTAKYVVLTRHPAAIFSSYAESFFDGDYAAAFRFNPILARYIPRMAWLLREKPVPLVHVKYEDLVKDPEAELRRVSDFLGIPFEADAVNYKRKEVSGQGLGDPIGVKKHDRPVTSSVEKWVKEFVADDARIKAVAEQLATVSDEDLEIWGYPRATLWASLEAQLAKEAEGDGEAAPKPVALKPKKKKWDRYAAQRRMLVWIRKDIDRKPWGKLLRKVRFTCDVLLRDGFSAFTPAPTAGSPAERGEGEAAYPKGKRPSKASE